MTHLEHRLARIRDSLTLARSLMQDARSRLDDLPHGTIDGVAWGERRQAIESEILQIDEMTAELIARIEVTP